jgi:acetyl-CoA decarbonylase/synthase complex subunit delta
LLRESGDIVIENVTLDVKELKLRIPIPSGQRPTRHMRISLEPEIPGQQRTEFLVPIIPAPTVQRPPAPTPVSPAVPRVAELIKSDFSFPTFQYPGSIAEVQIGATRGEGGSRGRTYRIGGEKSLPFWRFDGIASHLPVVALDTFDLAPPLARPVKDAYKDVLEDPAAWAKLCVEKYEADLPSLHLVGTDPGIKNTSAADASKLVEDVLQAVDTPIIVGGSGNPQKDTEVFNKIAETTKGEHLIFSSLTTDMDVQKTIRPIIEGNHDLIALAFMDITQARELCRKSQEGGLPRSQLILDNTTGGLGYGIEYSFSIFQRIRFAALMGEEVFQVPMSSASTNAWAAREAWQKPEVLRPSDSVAPIESWGPRELRGPMWEATTALILSLCGAELFMMMHPLAVKLFREFGKLIAKSQLEKSLKDLHPENWVEMKV